MKRMTTLLLSVLLILSLTACGRKNDQVAQDNMAGNDNTVTDQSGGNRNTDNNAAADNNANMGSNYETPHIDGAETPAESSGKSAMRKGSDAVGRAAERAGEDVKETLDGESWDGMLRNGRVRDTDGKLKDGENALHGRYGVNN